MWLQHAVCGPLLVNLARLLADPVEKCREGALSILSNAAMQLPDPPAMLPSLMPAVVARMGDTPVVEPSEELRLGLIDLVAGPVITRCGPDLVQCLGLIVQVICRSLEDEFHNIKKVRTTFPAGSICYVVCAACCSGSVSLHKHTPIFAYCQPSPHFPV